MQFALIPQKVSGVLANISAVRRSKGYSEEYMADIMNMPQDTYTGIEAGNIALTLQNVIEIAFIFQIDTASLLTLDIPKLPILRLVI
ncbi:helix-turn-helix transcriptional regulator [Mucilaginibacter sp. CAU 1740]|uniref:helix-turn-helix domain-containing protein n=1 Tax=Mucilaginibacter sp. CAU 1740 TaxID=3140365 RepID=UPI00325BE5C9